MDNKASPPNTTNASMEIDSPNKLLLTMWRAGQRVAARNLELATRAASPTVRLYSTYTEEILEKYIGHTQPVVEMKEMVRKLAIEDDSVLIIGPTGTGKELIARALHGYRNGKFIGINCTALPSEMIESELFGHVKGAFTGALDDRVGKIQAAWGGTLFLDEIGDMPFDMQAKLLRVLQEKVYSRIGDDKNEQKMNCRIVAATHRDVTQLFSEKINFREDLFWRIATFVVNTIPLIERHEDIAELVDSLGGSGLYDAFSKFVDEKHGSYRMTGLYPTEEALERMLYKAFFNLSGNMRSLQAQVRRYQVLGVTR